MVFSAVVVEDLDGWRLFVGRERRKP